MSLESEIKNLASAIWTLHAALTANGNAVAPVAPVSGHVPPPLPEPVAAPAPAPAAPVAPKAPPMPAAPAAPPMPAAPFPGNPPFVMMTAPAPAAPARPFNDVQGCVQWVVSKFHELGPKGQGIQTILAELGITNISNVKPEQFDALFAKVSAL